MKKTFRKLLIYGTVLAVCGCRGAGQRETWEKEFADPSDIYRPQPFWHINGTLTTEGIRKQLSDAIQGDGFGGVAILPLNPGGMWGNQGICPGTTPVYLSEGYFNRYRDILECSAEQGAQVILYDDVDFPSGTAGGKLGEQFPQYTRKRLCKTEEEAIGPKNVKIAVPLRDSFMGAAAMNTLTLERIDLGEFVTDNTLEWQVPEGTWKIMSFAMENHVDNHVDYMEPKAVKEFMKMTYDQYAERFEPYFGNTITKTFFDDVGYYGIENYWNPELSGLFEKRYGKKAALYYPALWYDIGPETDAARVALFGLRAEAMGDGFPLCVAEWCDRYGLQSMGHPPGNYEPTTVDMYGDPFKFYRHVHIPLMDAIHGYPYGRPGFKLISSAADAFDKQLVGAEIYGNYSDRETDSAMLYRVAMEVMARGVNFLVPHGMWYEPDTVKIPPLIAHYNPRLAPALPGYNDFAGRSTFLLQGGRRVADIALLFPIQSLEAWYAWETGRPRCGKDVPPGTDYNRIGDLLTGQIQRDFTFLHPEDFVTDKYQIGNGQIKLNTPSTGQTYKLLIMPSGKVLSVETLRKIRDYYRSGGKILATNLLPSRSAEFGQDAEAVALVREIFGIDPEAPMPARQVSSSNENGGKTIFLPQAESTALAAAIDSLLPDPDVRVDPVETLAAAGLPGQPLLGVERFRDLPADELGMFSYIHKQKEGQDIYLFANSTDKPVDTQVSLKGKLKLEKWNPHTGTIGKWEDVEYDRHADGTIYTRIRLMLEPVSAVFAIGK